MDAEEELELFDLVSCLTEQRIAAAHNGVEPGTREQEKGLERQGEERRPRPGFQAQWVGYKRMLRIRVRIRVRVSPVGGLHDGACHDRRL